jgi:iron complex outermembrane receptor protein
LIGLQVDRILNKRWNATVSARFVEQYDFYSGSQIGTKDGKGKRGFVLGPLDIVTREHRRYIKNFNHGPLGGFTTIDFTTSYEFNDNIRLNIGITNLLNAEQVEFVGSPSIGRLVMTELRLRVW